MYLLEKITYPIASLPIVNATNGAWRARSIQFTSRCQQDGNLRHVNAMGLGPVL